MDAIASSFAMPPSSSSSTFDLSEVDFDYISKLTKKDSKKLRGIIVALEQEGAYPDLLKTAKAKLAEVDPKSVAPSFNAPSSSDSAAAISDLSEWLSSVKEKDSALLASKSKASGASAAKKSSATATINPSVKVPVRGHVTSAFEDSPPPPAAVAEDDAEDELTKTIGGDNKKQKKKKQPLSLGLELNPKDLSTIELQAAALLEREKGNECYRAKEYADAVKYYTRSLHLLPTDTLTLNNRAITFIKQKEWDSALNDVSLVLQKESRNWKALWRRGQVWQGKLFHERALDDFRASETELQATIESLEKSGKLSNETVQLTELRKSIKKTETALLAAEPNHPYVQHLKSGGKPADSKKKEHEEMKEAEPITTTTKGTTEQPVVKQFKRMQIAEVDDDDDEEEEDEKEEERDTNEPKEEKQAETKPSAPIISDTKSTAPAMKRMPIQEVDDDDEEEEAEEIVADKKKQSTSTAATSTPAPAPVAASTSKPSSSAAAPPPKSKPAPAFHSKNGGCMIELVDDDDDDEVAEEKEKEVVKKEVPKTTAAPAASTSKPSVTAAASSKSTSSSSPTPSTSSSSSATSATPFTLPPLPTTSLQFSSDWRSLKQHGDTSLTLSYVTAIPPTQYTELFKKGIDSTILSELVNQILIPLLLPSNPELAISILYSLTSTDRFALNVTMLGGSAVKRVLKEKLGEVEERMTNEAMKDQWKVVVKKYT